ncbi:hypothetical protein OKW39_008915 [Paraburkholderia sp. MM6662-R1]
MYLVYQVCDHNKIRLSSGICSSLYDGTDSLGYTYLCDVKVA